MTYAPMAWLNDFWLLRDGLVPLNATTGTVALRLSVYSQKAWQHMMLAQLGESFRLQQSWGAMNEGEPDDLKRILTEGNPYFLALTMAVSLAHSVLDVLAFKADVGFWKGKQDVKGLSVRTIAFNAACQAIILLYLFDNDTSLVVLGSSVMGLAIECWKLTQAMDVSVVRGGGVPPPPPGSSLFTRATTAVTAALPYRLVLKDKASYSESDTDRFDKEATKYMGIALVPCVVGYSLYSLKTQTHRSFYSWAVASLVGAVYAFGFVLMCPQLWINYRLKVRGNRETDRGSGAWGREIGGFLGGCARGERERKKEQTQTRARARAPARVRRAVFFFFSSHPLSLACSLSPSIPLHPVRRPPALAPAGLQVPGHHRGRPVCVCDQNADPAPPGETERERRRKKDGGKHALGASFLPLSPLPPSLTLAPLSRSPLPPKGRLPGRRRLLRLPVPAVGVPRRPHARERVRFRGGAGASGRGGGRCAGGCGCGNHCGGGEWGGGGWGGAAAGWRGGGGRDSGRGGGRGRGGGEEGTVRDPKGTAAFFFLTTTARSRAKVVLGEATASTAAARENGEEQAKSGERGKKKGGRGRPPPPLAAAAPHSCSFLPHSPPLRARAPRPTPTRASTPQPCRLPCSVATWGPARRPPGLARRPPAGAAVRFFSLFCFCLFPSSRARAGERPSSGAGERAGASARPSPAPANACPAPSPGRLGRCLGVCGCRSARWAGAARAGAGTPRRTPRSACGPRGPPARGFFFFLPCAACGSRAAGRAAKPGPAAWRARRRGGPPTHAQVSRARSPQGPAPGLGPECKWPPALSPPGRA